MSEQQGNRVLVAVVLAIGAAAVWIAIFPSVPGIAAGLLTPLVTYILVRMWQFWLAWPTAHLTWIDGLFALLALMQMVLLNIAV